MSERLIIAGIIMTLGVSIIAFGVYLLIQSNKIKKLLIPALGKIIGHKETISFSSEHKNYYSPIIECNCKGKEFKFISELKCTKKRKIGRKIRVLINPINQKKSCEANIFAFYFKELVCFIIGMTFVIFGSYMLYINLS